MATEILKYEVLQKDRHFQIRQYARYITASVEIETNFKEALNSGLIILSDYFSGINWAQTHVHKKETIEVNIATHERIRITAPVYVTMVDEGKKYKISFIMPAKYTRDNLPEPINKQITFQRGTPYKAAAMVYRGNMDDNIAMERASELRTWVQNNGLSYKSKFTFAVLSSPLVPGRFKRWEILTKLEDLD